MSTRDSSEDVKKRYDRIAPIYDILEGVIERIAFSRWRQKFWQDINKEVRSDDRILEAGVGTGKNIPYYPSVGKISAIDFSPGMIAEAEKRLSKHDNEQKNIVLEVMDIEDLGFAAESFDIIVTTCVFCSVPNPVIGLTELKRVLQPKGRIYMLEHMLSHKFFLKQLMNTFNFFPRYLWGANINRRTMENIRKAGLNVIYEENIWLDIFKQIVLSKGG